VRFNRDGTLVVTASDDKTSRAFRADGSSGPDWSVTNSGWAVDFSPDGKYLACGTDNGVIAIYDAQSLRLLFWTRQQGAVQKVVFSPDSQTLLSAADNVLLVNLVPFRQLATFSKYKDPTSVAFSPDSLYFAESSIEGQVTVLSARPPGKFFQTLENHTGPVRVVTFAPGATSWELATASVDGTAAIWVKGSPYPLASLRVGADVYAAAFSPDGKFLATGSLDGTARLWSAPDGKQVGAVKYLADVRALDFSPDGKWLAIGSGDKTARIIEVATFKELERITYRAEVNSVAFSRDQKYLAVASSDGTAGTWLVLPSGSRLPSMNPAEMISLACKQITSDALLSESEWQQYFGREAYHPACNQQNTTFGGGSGFNGGGSSGKY
jgi:WD40 repeat protein